MIAFKDLVPQQIQKQGFIKPPQWETVWRLIDCSFGVVGIVPLWLCRRDIDALEHLELSCTEAATP